MNQKIREYIEFLYQHRLIYHCGLTIVNELLEQNFKYNHPIKEKIFKENFFYYLLNFEKMLGTFELNRKKLEIYQKTFLSKYGPIIRAYLNKSISSNHIDYQVYLSRDLTLVNNLIQDFFRSLCILEEKLEKENNIEL